MIFHALYACDIRCRADGRLAAAFITVLIKKSGNLPRCATRDALTRGAITAIFIVPVWTHAVHSRFFGVEKPCGALFIGSGDFFMG